MLVRRRLYYCICASIAILAQAITSTILKGVAVAGAPALLPFTMEAFPSTKHCFMLSLRRPGPLYCQNNMFSTLNMMWRFCNLFRFASGDNMLQLLPYSSAVQLYEFDNESRALVLLMTNGIYWTPTTASAVCYYFMCTFAIQSIVYRLSIEIKWVCC